MFRFNFYNRFNRDLVYNMNNNVDKALKQILSADDNDQSFENFLSILPLIKGKTVLDVGSGCCTLANFLRNKYKVTACDVNYNILKKYSKVKYRICKSENLPFLNQSFDTVICCDVLEHCFDFDKSIRELLRVGSRVIIKVPWGTYEDNEFHVRIFNDESIFLKYSNFTIITQKTSKIFYK